MAILSQYPDVMAYSNGGKVRERRDDTARQFVSYAVDGTTVTGTQPYDAAENAAADARATQATRATNSGTLTSQAVAAIAANETWIANTAPQVQTGVDAIQARVKPVAPTTIAQSNAILDVLWTDVKALSQAVETLNAELVTTKRQNNAVMRLVAGALDSTSGT